jgi:putative membrane-bound dehydrogenase-like protein
MKRATNHRVTETTEKKTLLVYFSVISVTLWLNSSSMAEPLSPKDELATFKTLPGFKVELVASEPDVIDPVAMAFDEKGRLFVCEMRGYPNGGVATGEENRGRIRCLTDENGDGVYEKSVIFADKLRFPTGVLPWKGGVLVCNAPDLIYLPDDNNDNKADSVKILYSGFGLNNIQQILNSLRWGIDNWVYAVVGSTGGTITCPSKPDMKPLVLRGRGIRFKPDDLSTLEATSGGGQYGLTCDEAQHWFSATNSQHLRQIVLPDHYLRRNPYFAAPSTTIDIPEHGAACKVFRISPFEQWRVERTTRRKDSPEAKRFSPTELVPGGYITSACSPCYYGLSEPLFPEKDRGCVYVCDPANNLITRDKLVPNGSIYKGVRIDDGVEFLASTDNWFRPVHLTIGPEGALYVCDFYREVIETPLSLPDDIKKKLNLESRERGRIWRIVPEGFKAKPIELIDKSNESGLFVSLHKKNQWSRSTASRLLCESGQNVRWQPLQFSPPECLWTVEQLGLLEVLRVQNALDHHDPKMQIHGLRLAERLLKKDEHLREFIAQKLVDDISPMVRFQVALTIGEFPPDEAGPLLAKLLRHKDADSWLESAALSSAKDAAPSLLESLATDAAYAKSHTALLGRLAAMIGARGDAAMTARVLQLLAKLDSPAVQSALLDGLGQGARNSAKPLNRLWDDPSPELKPAIEKALAAFTTAATTAHNEKASLAARQAAVRLLASGPYKVASEPLATLLDPRSPAELQSAALRSLASFDDPKVADTVLAAWESFGPTLRREAIEVLFARKDRIAKLLDAVEAKKVLASHIEAARAEELRKHADTAIRTRVTKLFAGQIAADRKKIIDDYKPALTLKGDINRGREVFRKNCTACHRLENNGYEVGASLTAALKNKTKEALIIDILDPSREVDPRFVNYQVRTTAGRTVSGLLAVETPTSLTLRRGEKAEDTILRSQIEEVRATSKSLMPEELEKVITREQLADLMEYLLDAGK